MPVDSSADNFSSTSESECSAEIYRGSVCKPSLLKYQNQIPGSSGCESHDSGTGSVFIGASISQDEVEIQVSNLLSGLQLLNPSAVCMEAVEPFLCLYYFGLCDNSSGQLYLLSSEECETITTETCSNEFETAVHLLGSQNLPRCNLLHTFIEMDISGEYSRRAIACTAYKPVS